LTAEGRGWREATAENEVTGKKREKETVRMQESF
jgi:hypothetical protein